MEVSPICFEVVYFFCGVLCLLFGILYTIFIWKDFKNVTPKLPCYKSSQVLFIIGSIARGLGYIAQATITILFYKDYNTLYMCDPITIGLPSYILTLAYLFLFYLWISICVNIISNDSTTGLRDWAKYIFNALLIFILTLGFVLTGIVILSFVQNYYFLDIVHEIEVLIAISRDFITATIILIYSILMIKMSNKPIFSKNKESIYFWMLVGLIVPLYVRSGSLCFFLYVIINKIPGRRLENFINTTVSAFISELLPCFIILLTWKRSGFLSVYDSLN